MLLGGKRSFAFLLEHGRKKLEGEKKIVEIFLHTFFPIDVKKRHRSNTFGLFFSPPSSAFFALFAPDIDVEDY
mgnify:CR=1 FL=1|jgi:hypothetical protein